MAHLIQFMHVSLDGFVAGTQGEMDWIHVDDEIFEYVGETTNRADMALYGRNTYNMMEAYWPNAASQPNASKHDIEHSNWYNKVPKIVLSHRMQSDQGKKVTVVSDNLKSKITEFKKQAQKNIIIFGSPGATHSLMAENLIDEFWLFVNPVLIGNGIPMFKNISERTKLELKTCKQFSSGVVCLHYIKK